MERASVTEPAPRASVSTPRGSEPTVSVVVIVFDGERFLGEALESIAAQRFDAWEAIVVDDGSHDRSVEIARAFAERHRGKVRLLAHAGGANRGMSASRNLGTRAARGEFVTFLDHDDAMLPEKLARQVELLRACPTASAVVGPNLRWRSWSDSHGNGARAVPVSAGGSRDEVQDLGVGALDAGRALELDPPGLLPMMLANAAATPQAPMIRRERLRAIGGFEESFRGMYEDQVFLAKLFLSDRVAVSGEVWHRYRQHDESCVRVAHRSGTQHAARRRFLAWLEARLDARREDHRGIAREIRRARWASWRAQLGLARWRRMLGFTRG